jgi:hypothetical protein
LLAMARGEAPLALRNPEGMVWEREEVAWDRERLAQADDVIPW